MKKNNLFQKIVSIIVGTSLGIFLIFGSVWLAVKTIKAVFNLF